MANQVDFKIAPSDQFSVYSPSTRSEKTITYFTLLSKLRGDILAVSSQDDPNNIVSAYYSNAGGVQTLHLVKADGSEVTASQSEQVISGTLNYVSKFTSSNDIGNSQIFDDGTNVGIGTTTMTHKLQLGTGGVFADYFQLDTTYSNGFVVGALSWDSDNGTADLGLSGSLKLKIGQDDVWYVKNSTGSAINKGTAVYASGTLGASSKILISPMIADGSIPARFFLGIVAETIANGSEGYVLTKGKLRNINTNAYNEGDVLWVSPSVAGALTATEPTAPNLKLPVAFVVNKGNNGVLAVRSTTGTRIADASDVDYTGAADNSFLVYNSSTGVWEDETIGIFKTIAVSGQSDVVADSYTDTLTLVAGTNVTITTDATTDSITINSTDQYVGTVTSVATTAPITGGTITSTGTIGITQSGTASDGYLSSTDWNTFNSKEPALTKGNLTETTSSVLTITGGTNAVIGTGTTIAVSQAGASSSGYLSSTDWNTFNNKASNSFTTIAVATQSNIVADSATDTLTIAAGTGVTITTDALTDTLTISATGSGGTVTSVDLTAGTGISVSGGPITTSGSITVTNTAPDQIVVLNAGTGITTSGTYPNFTITNAAPDQTVALTAGTGISVSGTYPNFTITNTSTSSGGTVTSIATTAPITGGTITTTGTIGISQSGTASDGYLSSTDWNTFNGKASNSFTTIAVSGQSNIVADSASDTLTVAAGTGVTITTDAATDTITINATGTGGTVTSVDLTAGTGISVSGGPITSSGNITVTNTAPDQTVVLTAGTGITTSGTYPNFTITNSSPSSGGTVTSIDLTAGDRIEVSGGPITTSGSITVTHGTASGADFTTAQDFEARVIADGGTFEALGEVAIAIGSLEDAASPSSTDYNDGFVLQNIAIDTYGHVLGVGATDLDDRYAQVAFKNIAVSGQTTIEADAIEDTLTVAAGTGISVTTTAGSDTLTITNSDTGSAQNIFKNIAVSGQSTVVADSNNDTLTLVAGTGISITTSAATDTITITNSQPASSTANTDSLNFKASTPYTVTTPFNTVIIDSNTVELIATNSVTESTKMLAIVTLEVANTDSSTAFTGFTLRLYNSTDAAAVSGASIRWSAYMYPSASEFGHTSFTYHIPIEDSNVTAGDTIQLQLELGVGTCDITSVSFTLMAITN